MAEFPKIRTAIPLRRYQLEGYAVSVLGEIESGDGVDYRFITAFVAEGDARPSLFVCAERNQPREPGEGAIRLRVVNSAMSEVLGSDDAFGDLDRFVLESLRLGRTVLGLGEGEAHRLL